MNRTLEVAKESYRSSGLERTRSDNFTGGNGNSQPPVIEVLNVDRATSKGGKKVNLGVEEKIVILALEARVGLLLDLEDDITRENTRHLVTLTAELDLVAVLHTTVDVDVEDLALDNGLLTVAALAAVLLADDLTLTVTVRADGLEPLDHGAHLAHHGLHTGAIATRARLDGAFLTAAAITARANDRLLQSQLGDLAAVDILEVDLMHVVNSTGLLGTRVTHTTAEHATETAAAAEELSKEILGTHSSSAGTTFETLLTELVVDLTLLRIGQDFVGMRQFLELLGSFGVVRVLVCEEAEIRECPW